MNAALEPRLVAAVRAIGERLAAVRESDPIEQLPADRLHQHGDTATSVMVTIELEALRSALGLAQTSTAEVITAAEARRMACTADIVPVVLGGAPVRSSTSARARRLFSPAQRKAMAIRDRHCRAEGCDIPAPGARPTTPPSHGRAAGGPISPTASCCARSTTTTPTTRAGRSAASPVGMSVTPLAQEPEFTQSVLPRTYSR